MTELCCICVLGLHTFNASFSCEVLCWVRTNVLSVIRQFLGVCDLVCQFPRRHLGLRTVLMNCIGDLCRREPAFVGILNFICTKAPWIAQVLSSRHGNHGRKHWTCWIKSVMCKYSNLFLCATEFLTQEVLEEMLSGLQKLVKFKE